MSDLTPEPVDAEPTTDALGEEDPGGAPGEQPAERTTDALGEEDPGPPPERRASPFGEF